jgi:hypothetical protein
MHRQLCWSIRDWLRHARARSHLMLLFNSYITLDRAARGNVEEGLIFAGTNAGHSEKIVPVKELMAELVTNLSPG